MKRSEVIKRLKLYLLTHSEVYHKYLWMYFLDMRYNLHLSIKEKDLCDASFKLYHAWRMKKNRIKRMLDFMIMKNRKTGLVWFCTFTFTEDYLSVSHGDVLKRFKILDWCILNEDWGKTTNRRHYHAIIGGLTESQLHDLWSWGFVKFKRVHFNLVSYEKVGAYIVKLSQHAIKKEVSRNLYYSKKLRFLNR